MKKRERERVRSPVIRRQESKREKRRRGRQVDGSTRTNAHDLKPFRNLSDAVPNKLSKIL